MRNAPVLEKSILATVPLQPLNAQPFVKWVGGKRYLLSKILSLLPLKFNDYHEPFVGGGALYFAIANRVKNAALVDNNIELVMAYKAIQKQPLLLIEKLKKHDAKHDEDYYYKVREQEPQDPIDIAARFLYLNKTGYNGLYRVNKSGKFNTPVGSYKNPNIIQEENIFACHEALRNATIIFEDFEAIKPVRGDLVYFDPPYHPTDEMSFTEYTKENFTEKDQVRLRDFIVELHHSGVKVMLSNSKTKFIEDIYRAKYFKHHVVHAPRFINCKSNKRDKVKELLITNY